MTTTTWVGSGDVRVTGEGQQTAPAATGLAGGGYVLAWIVTGTGTSQVHAQRFDAGGTKLGAEMVLEQGPAYGVPGLVALADGSFVVSWDSRTDAAAPTNYLAQHFNANGVALGAAVQVNALPNYDSSSSAETLALAGGGWVVEWSQNPGGSTGWGPQLQVYTAGGAPAAGNESIGYEADGTPYGTGTYIHSSALAATADGGFVSVWTTSDAYQPGVGTTDHVYLQRFNASGTALAAPVEAITEPGSTLVVGGVETAVLAGSGNIVISVRGTLPDGRSEITAQRFDSAGHALAGAQTIVSATAVLDSKVTALSDGTFVVSWMDSQVTQDLKQQQTVYAQHYDSTGVALGAQVLVGTSQAVDTHYTVAATPDGGAEFAWDDGRLDSGDVYAEHFAPSVAGDQVPPTVVAFSPGDGAVNVPLNTNVTVTFSEAIQRGAGSIVLHDAAGHVVATYDAATSTNLAVSGATLTIDPSSDLAAGTDYFVDLPAGSVTDLAGNAYAGTSTYDFVTAQPPPAPVVGTSGNDVLNVGAGDVHVDGGAGTDTAVLAVPLSAVQSYSWANGILTLGTLNGTDSMVNIERVRFSDALFALDTQAPSGSAPGGHVWQAAALFQAGFGALPALGDLSHWTAEADRSASMGELGQKMIDFYAPGISSDALVTYLYQQLVHAQPPTDVVQSYVNQIGPGKTFATQGDLLAYAASLSLNTDHLGAIVGTIQHLDPSWF